MRLRLIIILIILNGCIVSAQRTWQEADSVSYALYNQAKWQQLADYGLKASEVGFTFYYLNLRTGIALYELGNLQKAEKWFDKAVKNYIFDAVAKEYLYWIYVQTGRSIEAANLYKELPPSVKTRLHDAPSKFLSSIYVEGGLKTSNQPDSVKPFQYFSIGLAHKFSPQLSLYHAYSYMKQDHYLGGYTQHQYYFAPTLALKNGLKIKGGVNLFKYQNNYDVDAADRIYTDSIVATVGTNRRVSQVKAVYGTNFKGILDLKALYGHLGLSKNFGQTQVELQYAYYSDKSNLFDTKLVDSISVTTTFFNNTKIRSDTLKGEIKRDSVGASYYSQHQIGVNLAQTFNFRPGYALTLGAEAQYVLGNTSNLIVMPYFNFLLNTKFCLSGYYLKKGYLPLSVFNGSLVINNYDNYQHRLSLTARYDVTRQLGVYLTGQLDRIDDGFTGKHYTLSGLFVGLKGQF